MAAHNDLIQLMDAPFVEPDPGNGGAITTTKQVVALVNFDTGASGETGTIGDPAIAGQVLFVRLETDGGGNRVYTASSAVNATGNNTLTFGDANDYILLYGVPNGTGFRWEAIINNGVSLSTV